jgi:hypothetical protein
LKQTDDVHPNRVTGGFCRLLALGTLAAAVLAGALPTAETESKAAVAEPSAPPAERARSETSALGALWADTAGLLAPTAAGSKSVLLGKRDPNGPSCFRGDEVIQLVRVPDGGVSTGTTAVMADARSARGSPADEFLWHQGPFKAYCEGLLARNHTAYAKALRLADQAGRLSAALAAVSAFPADLTAAGLADDRSFLGRTAWRLDEALAARDLDRSRRLAREFHEAAERLADLHRWVDLLVRNQLSALVFQNQCRSLYLTSERTFDLSQTVADVSVGDFPGAANSLCLLYNLHAVEQQAEWLFATLAAPDAPPTTASAVAMPPHLRRAFGRLRSHLSARTRPVWDRAAAAPHHRTYLANVLNRYQAAGALDPAGLVLEQWDRTQEAPTVETLLDVLFYRGGSPTGMPSAAAERFDTRLMQAARLLAGTPEQAILRAQHFTRALFGTWDNYGAKPTLAASLDTGRFDCISASNAIGSIYRNAGRGGLYAVRWCAGSAGHSVVGVRIERNGTPAIGIVDGLDEPQTAVELWPHAYVQGPEWPAGYVGVRAPVYAVELYGRALDSYLWCQGFIVRGENAGTLVRSTIPYLPAWTHTGIARGKESPGTPSPTPPSED